MLSSRPDTNTLRLLIALPLLTVAAFHGLLASCNPVESRLRIATNPSNTAESEPHALMHLVPDFDENCKVCGYFSIGVDITALKLAEQESLHLREQLLQSTKWNQWVISPPESRTTSTICSVPCSVIPS